LANPARTLVCSILFVDIVEYSKKSVAEQLLLKQTFNRLLSRALETIAAAERVILDTGDGAAIAFLGDPQDALFVSLTIRENTTIPVRMGVNLGPVRLVRDISGQANIIGDGINVAQASLRISVRRAATETEKIKGRGEWRNVALWAEPVEPAAQEERPVQIFDAGEHLIVSGYSKSSVDQALKTLAEAGSRVISAAARVSEKWIASCEHPAAQADSCKVVTIEGKQIVTGPTREAVSGGSR